MTERSIVPVTSLPPRASAASTAGAYTQYMLAASLIAQPRHAGALTIPLLVAASKNVALRTAA